MKTQGKKLTNKQKAFLIEYQKDWNAVQAAIRAGYTSQTAEKKSYQLVGDSRIVEALDREMTQRLKKVGAHAEKVLTELARVALSDTRKLYRADGSLRSPSEWDDETAAAIAGVETFEEFEGKGKDRKQIGWTKKVRVFDKVRALENLGKHLRLFPEGDRKIDLGITGKVEVGRPLTNLELAAKIVYLITLAEEKRKAMESKHGDFGDRGEECNPRPQE